MVIGFNPNYPSLHMREALEAIVSGEADILGWNAEEKASVVAQAKTLISERGESFIKAELSRMNSLLRLIEETA
jgi:hypothetical protein